MPRSASRGRRLATRRRWLRTSPAGTRLAGEFSVATNTVRKALGILRDEGLIESVPGYGTFVRKP